MIRSTEREIWMDWFRFMSQSVDRSMQDSIGQNPCPCPVDQKTASAQGLMGINNTNTTRSNGPVRTVCEADRKHHVIIERQRNFLLIVRIERVRDDRSNICTHGFDRTS